MHAEQFYGDALGFAVTQRSYPGALFLGRDGYHHHIGANTWRSRQAAVPGTLGLVEFTLRVSRRDEFADDHDAAGGGRTAARAADAVAMAEDLDGLTVRILRDDER